MIETIRNIGWSVVFSVVAGLVGTALVMMASAIIPRLIDRLTPNIDEQREIARGKSGGRRVFWSAGRSRHSRSECRRGRCHPGWLDRRASLRLQELTAITESGKVHMKRPVALAALLLVLMTPLAAWSVAAEDVSNKVPPF